MSEINDDTIQRLLSLELGSNDADAATVGDYLAKLLTLVWRDGAWFDGKRPFGNSFWQWCDVYPAMVRAGFIEGKFYDGDVLNGCDEHAADGLIYAAIEAMGRATGAPAPEALADAEAGRDQMRIERDEARCDTHRRTRGDYTLAV